jgi:hypothetical protein
MISVLVTYDFGMGSSGCRLLRDGWASPETGFVWSVGDLSIVEVPHPGPRTGLQIEVTLAPFVLSPQVQHQYGHLILDGGTASVGGRLGGKATWRIELPPGYASPTLKIALRRTPPAQRAPALLPAEKRDLGFKLIELKLLQSRPARLPPARRPMREWRFGWNETTESCLADGWAEPEDGFVWAIGRTARLQLPIEPSSYPRPSLLLLDMRPVGYPGDSARQRVAIAVDGRPLSYVDLRQRITVAFPVHPRAHETHLTLRFDHFDAADGPCAVAHHSGAPLAWALACARLVPQPAALPPAHLPALLPPVPNQFSDGSLAGAVKGRTGLSIPELLSRFEGIGSGCWLGLLQAKFGMMPIGLLTYAGVLQFRLVDGIFAGFADLGRPDQKVWAIRWEGDTTWRMMDLVYELSLATPYPRDVPPPENGFALASVSLPWLADKLMTDIANGEKLFVARPMEAPNEAAGLAVLAALRHFGDAQLLWVVEDGSGPTGSVIRLPSGLLKGHKDLTDESIVSVLANAYALLQSQ